MRKIIALILYWVYLPKIKRESSRTDSVLCIYGHDISSNSFENMIKWLLKKKYYFITQFELLDYINGNLAEEKKYVWLSFDDGCKSNYDNIFPILKKYNIPATIFIATKGIEDGYFWFNKARENRNSSYFKNIQELWEMPNRERIAIIEKLQKKEGSRLTMTPDELKEMIASGLICLENHTNDHVMTNNCTKEELTNEIELCQKKIKKWTDFDCNFIFSFPNGNSDTKSEQLIKEMGFQMATTTKMDRTFPNTNPFSIPRTEFKEASTKENILHIYNFWTPFFDKYKKILKIKNNK